MEGSSRLLKQCVFMCSLPLSHTSIVDLSFYSIGPVQYWSPFSVYQQSYTVSHQPCVCCSGSCSAVCAVKQAASFRGRRAPPRAPPSFCVSWLAASPRSWGYSLTYCWSPSAITAKVRHVTLRIIDSRRCVSLFIFQPNTPWYRLQEIKVHFWSLFELLVELQP